MTLPKTPVNRVREHRTALGITQAELALRAGVSRTAVTAIEGNRLVPSVAAALALGRALEVSVEVLFGEAKTQAPTAAWAWDPPTTTANSFWQAEVAGRHWLYPAESSPMLTPLPDGIASSEKPLKSVPDFANQTLVVACCDPAAGILASQYFQATGLRMLVVSRSSREAIELLKQGRVHVAGVHLSTQESPDQNARVVRERLGDGYQLLRVARWQEGIATTPTARIRSVRSALQSELKWVGREVGSGARQCLDRLLGKRPGPQLHALHHRGVAEAIRSGWADAGVCVQLASMEARLDFLPVQEEAYDLCIPRAVFSDARVQALIRVIRSAHYRRLLAGLPGYNTTESGSLSEVN